MNWEAVGAIGEVAAAVLLVFSLIYVGIQIRQNTGELRRSSFRSVFDSYSNLRHATISTPEISRLHFKALSNPEELLPEELYRVEQFYTELAWATFHLYETIETGMMKQDSLNYSFQFLAQHLISMPGSTWWHAARSMYGPAFAKEVDKALDRLSSEKPEVPDDH